jgi:hypothetical protein
MLVLLNPIYFTFTNGNVSIILCYINGLPWLRRLVTGLSTRRPWFALSSVHVGFMVVIVAVRHVVFRVMVSPVSIIHRVSPYFTYHVGDKQ